MDVSSFVTKYSTNKSIPTTSANTNTNTSTVSLGTQIAQNKVNNNTTSNSSTVPLTNSIAASKTGTASTNSSVVPTTTKTIPTVSSTLSNTGSTNTGTNLNQMFNNTAPDGTSVAAYNNRVNQTPLAKYFDQNVGVQNADTSATAATATATPTPVTIPTQQITDYLNNYNADRENKIRNLYSGNLASQNAGLKTALDTNLGNLKTAYDENLNNLRTAYDNNSSSLKTAYDKNLAQIANSYQQNLSDAEAYMAGISPQYQESINALGADYERQRRNNNMQAAVNGLNSGAGSQMALGQAIAYQRNQGNLARSENEALNEAERGIYNLGRDYRNQQDILNTEYANNVDKLNREYQNNLTTYGTTYQNNLANMKTNYENQIAQAAANNDYQLAAALLDEYGSQYDRMQQQASLLAGFGDFSAYAALYGQDAADAMKLTWALQNPQVAWASGNLKAEDYYALTGQYPNDPNAANTLGLAGSIYSKYMDTSPTTGYYNGVQQQQQTQNQSNDLLPFLSKYNY